MDQLQLIEWIQGLRSPALTTFFELITSLGAAQVYIALLPLLFWCVSPRHGYRFIVLVLVSSWLNSLIKELGPLWIADSGPFYITRPYQALPDQVWTCRGEPGYDPEATLAVICREEETYSFPSGHAQNAVVFWGYPALVLRKRWFSVLALAMITLICVSRIYLGQHWPIDVLGGALIGAALLAASFWLLRAFRSRPRLLNTLLLVTTAVAIPLALWLDSDPTFNRSRALGLLAGAAAGYAVQRDYVPFPVQVAWPLQLAKAVAGIIGIMLLQLGLLRLLPLSNQSVVLANVLTGLWVTLGAPALFAAVLGRTVTPETQGTG